MNILNTISNERAVTRSIAKTYIYALLLGAGVKKQSAILGFTPREAVAGLEAILDFYPGWKELKNTRLKDDAKRGYFEGLDGRLVMFPSAHHILAGYLQNGESVVMKKASLLWHDILRRMKIPFKFVNDVHDEWQTETLPEYAEQVGEIQAESIRIVGEQLKLNCPLAGKSVIGKNWKETH
jgi:DNA polymerase I-like protein with 3'-5' exonuclease and polymerase domains